MPGGLTVITQDDFSGGMFEAPAVERIPSNGSYDIVNGLVDSDAGVIYRRGGSAYKTNAAVAGTVDKLWDGYLVGGHLTFFAATASHIINTDGVSPLQVQSSSVATGPRRLVSVGGLLALPRGTARSINVYGGSRLSASYTTGTIALTNGSAVVTGTGTSWLTTASVGQSLYLAGSSSVGVVQSVDTNLQVTLQRPYTGSTAAGLTYTLASFGFASFSLLDTINTKYLATVANRLIVAGGTRIVFGGRTPVEDVLTFGTTDYHELPAGAIVLGLQAVRDILIVFTSAGAYSISGLALDLTDASGNIQQQMDVLNPNMLLWHDNGLATWQGAAIVPATDNVYLFDGISAPRQLAGQIRKLYRSYVAAGHTLGVAAVFDGHYVLPILSSANTWVDTLVCNLMTGAWTRLAGQGGSSLVYFARGEVPAYSDALGSYAAQAPSLLSGQGSRVLDLTGIFSPVAGNKNDADGTTHTFSVTTRDYVLGSLKGLVKKIRLWAEGVDAASDSPTVTAAYAEGVAGSTFTSLTGTAGASDGEAPAGVFPVNHADRHIRFKLTSTSPWASLKIKSLDIFVRPRGRV